jgi:hypothetical protein
MSFISAVPQILRKICQTHHDNCQSQYVWNINSSREGSGQDYGNNSSDDGSDNKNLELVQFIGLSWLVLIKIVIILVGNNRQC